MYGLVRWLIRIVLQVFFRHRAVTGREHIPIDGPVLLLGNHPNSLVDPMLIIATAGRKVHFAAKATLFRIAPFRPILAALGAVPIFRRVDTGTSTVDNNAAFDAMATVLARGGAIGMFPEGLSHDDSQLAQLRTGAARLALTALTTGSVTSMTIVPCGLTFTNPKRFRSSALVQYGEPIRLTHDDVNGADPDAVRKLTSQIDAAIRQLTINAADWDIARALDTVRRLYQPPDIALAERAELARRFNAYYPRVAHEPRVRATLADVRAYQDALDDLGLTDCELMRDLSKRDVSLRMAGHVLLMSIWVPLAVPGVPLHVPALLTARLAGRSLSARGTVVSTTKILVGLVMSVLLYGVVIAACLFYGAKRWAAVLALLLPLSGWATLRVLDRAWAVRRGLRVFLRHLAFRREVTRLRHERARLAKEISALVVAHLPSDVTPLFPPETPP